MFQLYIYSVLILLCVINMCYMYLVLFIFASYTSSLPLSSLGAIVGECNGVLPFLTDIFPLFFSGV